VRVGGCKGGVGGGGGGVVSRPFWYTNDNHI